LVVIHEGVHWSLVIMCHPNVLYKQKLAELQPANQPAAAASPATEAAAAARMAAAAEAAAMAAALAAAMSEGEESEVEETAVTPEPFMMTLDSSPGEKGVGACDVLWRMRYGHVAGSRSCQMGLILTGPQGIRVRP
jgi:hypothetical protein